MPRQSKNPPTSTFEESWDEDLPLTQDQLAIIDGLGTQEQLQASKPEPPPISQVKSETAHHGNGSLSRHASCNGEDELNALSKDRLMEKVRALQQELFSASGLLAMREDEHRVVRERAQEEQKRLRSELSTLSAEFSRTAESLRSQLLFQTKECEDARAQLARAGDSRKAPARDCGPPSPPLQPPPPPPPREPAPTSRGFPTVRTFQAGIRSPRRPTPTRQQKRTADAATSTLRPPPAKRPAQRPSAPVQRLPAPAPAPAPTTAREEEEKASPLVRALVDRVSEPLDRSRRHGRELARRLVALHSGMVSDKIDFAVLSPLQTYERHRRESHPLSTRADEHYRAFHACFHRLVAAALRGPGRVDPADLLPLLPCLANHARLFAAELRRRRDFVQAVDADLSRAAGSADRLCPLTDTGPMDDFFDIVRELDARADDVHDCPHLLPAPLLDVFRKQVSFALQWLLVIHQFCPTVREWMHGREGDVPENVSGLLSNLRFYFDEELPIRRAALDLFTDLCREMSSATRAEMLASVRPFQLLLLCQDARVLSTLHSFEAMRHLVELPAFRRDFGFHGGRRHCLWMVVFHLVSRAERGGWDQRSCCLLIHQFASLAIAAARSCADLMDCGCACYRGMYEALATAALSQARVLFANHWDLCVIEAVERPLRALLFLLQSQGVQHFEEVTAALYPLFALISKLKRVETCRHYDLRMKSAMDLQLIGEFDDLEDEFPIGD